MGFWQMHPRGYLPPLIVLNSNHKKIFVFCVLFFWYLCYFKCLKFALFFSWKFIPMVYTPFPLLLNFLVSYVKKFEKFWCICECYEIWVLSLVEKLGLVVYARNWWKCVLTYSRKYYLHRILNLVFENQYNKMLQ